MRSGKSAPARFARLDYFPKGWDICVAQFVSLFQRFGYIYKPLSGGSWYSADERWKLTDSEILKAIACAHPKFYLGCRSSKTTRFAVLDIDANSHYHNQRSLDRLLQVLSQAGLGKSSLYRSSYSGGWHLYLFFDESVNSAELRRRLIALLTLHDFDIAKGKLEVFPHPSESSQGMGLRLPLQPGFAWLDKATLEVEYERSDLSATQALELFVDALDGDANSYAAFRNLEMYVQDLKARKASATAHVQKAHSDNVIPLRKAVNVNGSADFTEFVQAVFHRLPPGIVIDTWYKGRLYHLNGLSAPSQRADAIFCLGHYLFYGDPSRDLPAMGYGYEQEREWVIKEFLALHHNRQSKDINKGRADAITQVERAAHWLPAHKKGGLQKKYSSERPISWVRENENRKTNARKRIADALEGLKKLRRSFTTVELQEAARCSRRTLYDHADIWRKDYEDLAEGFFAICTDEYNAVVGAASPERQPPSAVPIKNMPPGLLAARQIAFEITRRSDRAKKEKQKAAKRLLQASENSWRSNVARLTKEQPKTLSVPQLKSLLPVLYSYQALAPTEEDLEQLQTYISVIKQSLSESVLLPVLEHADSIGCVSKDGRPGNLDHG